MWIYSSPKLWLLYKTKLEFLNFGMLLTFWVGWFILVGDCSVYYRMFSSIPGSYPLDASTLTLSPDTTTSLLIAPAYSLESLQSAGQGGDQRQNSPDFMSWEDGAEIRGRPRHLEFAEQNTWEDRPAQSRRIHGTQDLINQWAQQMRVLRKIHGVTKQIEEEWTEWDRKLLESKSKM